PLRLARRLGVAHVAVFRHLGGRGVGGFRGGIGHVLGGGLRVLHARALHLLGFGGFALLTLILLALLVLAVLLVFGVGGTVLAHFERIEQVAHGVAELALIFDQRVEPVEILAGAVLDQRPPQIDELLRRRRRRLAGQALAHQKR